MRLALSIGLVLAASACSCGVPEGRGPCAPMTCESVPGQCGEALDDGCGGTLACGCAGATVCFEGQCCAPATRCADLGKNCGPVSDGCGGTLDCGVCTGDEFCGGAGVDHVCARVMPFCSVDGWCEDWQMPMSADWTTVAAASADHVFVGGSRQPAGGIALVDLGAEGFQPINLPDVGAVLDVAASGPDSAFVYGRKKSYRWDGKTWAPFSMPAPMTVSFVSTSAANDLWVATAVPGLNIVVSHWDGKTWASTDALPGEVTFGLWAVGDGTAYLAHRGNLVHITSDLRATPATVPFEVYGVQGTGPKDFWIAGQGIAHFDGAQWTKVSSVAGSGVCVVAADDVWFLTALGLSHWDGKVFEEGVLEARIRALARVPGTKVVWAVGEEGQLWVHDGEGWRGVNALVGPAAGDWSAQTRVTRLADETVVASGSGVTGTFDGTRWAAWRYAGSWWNETLCGSGESDLWATDGRINHFDGTKWTRTDRAVSSWGGSPQCAGKDVWFIRQGGGLDHFDGATWSTELENESVRFISAAPSGDLWVLGNELWHWDRMRWSRMILPTHDYDSAVVEAVSSTEAWIIGGTFVEKFDARAWTWTIHSADAGMPLTGIFRSADSAGGKLVIAVSPQAPSTTTLLEYDGTTWRREHLAGIEARSVAVDAKGDVFVSGSDGRQQLPGPDSVLMWRRPGETAWHVEARPGWVREAFRRVGGRSPDAMWAVGEFGTAAVRDQAGWLRLPRFTPVDLNAADRVGDLAWLVGDFGVAATCDPTACVPRATNTGANLRGVRAFATDDVWIAAEDAGLLHWNGSAFSVEQPVTGTRYLDVAGSSAGDLWALTDGYLLRRQNGTWSEVARAPLWAYDLTRMSFGALGLSSAGAWVGADHGVIFATSPAWNGLNTSLKNLRAVAGLGANDVWAASDEGLTHWDGATWTGAARGFTNVPAAQSISAPDDRHLWAVQTGTILRFAR